ncbi:hypothetical protein [Vibrio aerogenes]|uniref:hypothetical protein n=1 Tax=Vibrio aerogenes TaxID=92172 RepID=UPI0009366A34|nr:hypothetical protein [Vibrio aerogenes]
MCLSLLFISTHHRHLTPGSLPYFALYSHSISKQELWPEIEQLLIPLLPAPAFPVTPQETAQEPARELNIEYH